ERVRPEQVRLDPEQVPVAAGVVQDRVDPHLLLQQHAERLRAHARRGARPVGDVDRVDLVLLAVLRALDDLAGVRAARRVELDRDHELAAERAREPGLLLARPGWNMRTERTRSRMCAGVVPQQPPTTLAPASRKRRAQVAMYSGVQR